ncbi:conserved hypothetical protein [Altererythrobacter sp. B11]|uniref:hypothetical protein n=1 Tax=Altererythrobacter sp. B11 TaxID=2060312 RepID=UPI000DC6D7CD|nr:hypothetical protein [Altererythrobacter sp. B11]BBC71121.1 conserved hypothetical protein [Altererythrobacter sp. B11]
MRLFPTPSIALRAAVPLAAALSLAACGGNDTEKTYEADATDVSGGDLIVTEETPAVPVDLPDTPMTPVPDASATPGATDTPSATPAQ